MLMMVLNHILIVKTIEQKGDEKMKQRARDKKSEIIAEYFHKRGYRPDEDGYLGVVFLNRDVMRAYKKIGKTAKKVFAKVKR